MATEIERKFLVDENEFKLIQSSCFSSEITQGYIPRGNSTTVRIRVQDDKGYLTLKGKTKGFSRSEFEYEIPSEDAYEMLKELCDKRLIEKRRFIYKSNNHKWEIDVFSGSNDGLIIAEIELDSEDEDFEKPDFIREEVTDDKKYYNANLMDNPYSVW